LQGPLADNLGEAEGVRFIPDAFNFFNRTLKKLN